MADSLNDYEFKWFVGSALAGSVSVAGTAVTQPVNSVANYVGSVIIVTPKDAGTLTPTINGLVRYVTIVNPAMTGTGTSTMTVVDAATGTYFSQAGNESTTTTYGSVFPIFTTSKIICTANGTQAATGTVVFTMSYER